MTTTKSELLKAIHEHCLECCDGTVSWVQTCPGSESCRLHPYRLGKDPSPASAAKQESGRRLAAKRMEKSAEI